MSLPGMEEEVRKFFRRVDTLIAIATQKLLLAGLDAAISLSGIEEEVREFFQVDTLNPEHIEHLHDEGFSLSQIARWVGQG
jgi:hypothetical protein